MRAQERYIRGSAQLSAPLEAAYDAPKKFAAGAVLKAVGKVTRVFDSDQYLSSMSLTT